jgi:hypothetical protein
MFDKRNSLPKQQQQLRKSRSLTTEKTNLLTTVDMTLKRRSSGCIRQPSFYSSTSNSPPAQITKV